MEGAVYGASRQPLQGQLSWSAVGWSQTARAEAAGKGNNDNHGRLMKSEA
jgi:hypothetical protein